MSGPIALLDACVLVPTATREILLGVAREGAFQPRWSAQIEDEWRSAARRLSDAGAVGVDGEIALARAAFPQAVVTGWEARAEALSLPDWNDRHVLAAAIEAEAELLITDNLRDFPRRRLAGFDLEPLSADAFLWRLTGVSGAAIEAALARYSQTAPPELLSDGLAKHFKRMRLPRFAKAIAAGVD